MPHAPILKAASHSGCSQQSSVKYGLNKDTSQRLLDTKDIWSEDKDDQDFLLLLGDCPSVIASEQGQLEEEDSSLSSCGSSSPGLEEELLSPGLLLDRYRPQGGLDEVVRLPDSLLDHLVAALAQNFSEQQQQELYNGSCQINNNNNQDSSTNQIIGLSPDFAGKSYSNDRERSAVHF